MAKHSQSRARKTAASNTYRFFVDEHAIRGREVRIEDRALIHQLTAVLRIVPGMTITLLDNSGQEYLTRVDKLDRTSLDGTIEQQTMAGGEPTLSIGLYLALLKGDHFEWVLQKGTELGISAFTPVLSARTNAAAKPERWERILREAAEQCRRGRIPQLHPPLAFEDACRQASSQSPALLLWEGQGGTPLRTLARTSSLIDLQAHPPHISLISGPEGGWTDDEVQTAMVYNVHLVTLGPRTLRAETAPITAAVALFYECGDLG